MCSCIDVDALNFTDINVEGEINRRWWIDPIIAMLQYLLQTPRDNLFLYFHLKS